MVVGNFQSYVVFWCYHCRLQFKLAEEVFSLLVIKSLIMKFEGLPKKFKGSGAVQGGRFKFFLYTIPKMKRFCCIIKEVICFCLAFSSCIFQFAAHSCKYSICVDKIMLRIDPFMWWNFGWLE
jgi:hypothetical protein